MGGDPVWHFDLRCISVRNKFLIRSFVAKLELGMKSRSIPKQKQASCQSIAHIPFVMV